MADSKEKKLNPAISLVKVIAMFLIIHSHSDVLFPERLSFLATGGALGNELFFLIGGFLYSTNRSIGKTTYRRFIRLYIPTYIMTIMLYVFKIISFSDLFSVKELIYRSIWPTSFWFVSAIFFDGILFHLLYSLNCFDSKKKTTVLGTVFLTVYISLYVFFIPNKNEWIVEDYKFLDGMFYYKCVYSYAVFCIGYYIKLKMAAINNAINRKLLFPSAVVSFIMFYFFKYCLNKELIPMYMQIFSQPITVICVVSIMLWILTSNKINEWLQHSNYTADIINKLGLITLEAFLVQFELVSFVDKCNIAFPLNYFVNVTVIIIASYMFHIVSNHFCGFLIK